ncbi:thioesterase domain-containing protein [Yoonia algicola]|uniref:Thioesterase domain-containing protein n=1 Tax=Yoonia algicola TaxID=3137368 RepID=A0AAN0M4Z6_9RHOB
MSSLPRSSLKSLTKQSDTARPAYLIAGLGGHVLKFRPLARGIADAWHLTGVQYPVFAAGSAHCTSIENLCAEMSKPLENHEGPIVFLGYSIGGTIAYQMATDLRQQGKDVAVVMIDTTVSVLRPKRGPMALALQKIFLTWPRRLLGIKARKSTLGRLPDEPVLRNFVDETIAAMDGYHPPKSAVPVVLIRADSHRKWRRWINGPFWPSPTHGWARVAPVAGVVRCPGNHLTIVEPQNLEALITAVHTALGIAYESLAGGRKNAA